MLRPVLCIVCRQRRAIPMTLRGYTYSRTWTRPMHSEFAASKTSSAILVSIRVTQLPTGIHHSWPEAEKKRKSCKVEGASRPPILMVPNDVMPVGSDMTAWQARCRASRAIALIVLGPWHLEHVPQACHSLFWRSSSENSPHTVSTC